MSIVRMRQGDELILQLAIIENGSPVALTGAISVKADMLINNSRTKVYSLTPNIGEGMLEIDTLDTNKVNIIIQREDSINFPEGSASFYVLVEIPNTTFPDGGQTKSYQFNGALHITKGFARDIPMP